MYIIVYYTVIRFVWVSAKFGTCPVVSVNEALVEAKTGTFTFEYSHFICNKFPIYTYDGASAKSSTNSRETDYSVVVEFVFEIYSYIQYSCSATFL
jgi:hypothetical protein